MGCYWLNRDKFTKAFDELLDGCIANVPITIPIRKALDKSVKGGLCESNIDKGGLFDLVYRICKIILNLDGTALFFHIKSVII